MKSSDDLFQLIHSLTKAEKRYFKLFSDLQSGEKKYIRLFDLLERLPEYDEEAIRRQFRGEKFVRQLHVAKNYLYRMIIRALRAYHAEATPQIQMREMTTEIELLYERGLFRQAAKALRRAEKVAEETENHRAVLDLTDMRHKLSGRPGNNVAQLDDLQKRRKDALRNLELEEDYHYLLNRLVNLRNKGTFRTHEEQMAAHELMRHPLLQSVPVSPKNRAWYYWIYATYYNSVRDLPNALGYLQCLLELFEQQKGWINRKPVEYLALWNNRLSLLFRMRRYGEFDRVLKQLKEQIHPMLARNSWPAVHVGSEYMLTTLWMELRYLYFRGEYEQCIAVAENLDTIQKSYPAYRDESGAWMLIHLIVAYTHFSLGDLSAALDWTNRITQAPTPRFDERTYYSARIFECLLHYELGNIDLLPTLVRSVQRLLIRQDSLFEFERTMLEFFRKLMRAESRNQTMEAMKLLLAELTPLETDNFETFGFNYFNYRAWLTSKIENRLFRDVADRIEVQETYSGVRDRQSSRRTPFRRREEAAREVLGAGGPV